MEIQALIVAFDQTRTYDEEEMALKLAGARMPLAATGEHGKDA